MSEFPVVDAGDGVTRQVLSDHPDLMTVAFRFEKAGAGGAQHHHPHVQASLIQSGRFRVMLGGQTHEVGPGDSLIIPSWLSHGCVCIEPGVMIESFTPRRDDFL